ncbi:hypothetical protein [Paraburkholderia phosphatilytica]|uniref:hypothetical protein n=1 Tax=Paraburkholderia phosphatilytica TaxID=2282883 RepID=UPI0013DFBD38|nr:hypothetical protein [Paraburkholderia phosphatilytica]
MKIREGSGRIARRRVVAVLGRKDMIDGVDEGGAIGTARRRAAAVRAGRLPGEAQRQAGGRLDGARPGGLSRARYCTASHRNIAPKAAGRAASRRRP